MSKDVPMTREELTERHFLEMRCRVLDLAAAMDRLDRAGAPDDADTRLAQLRRAIDILSENDAGRAERVQLAFSREYDPDWMSKR